MAYGLERWLAWTCALGFALSACGKESDKPAPQGETRDVALHFEARVGAQLARCGESYKGLGKNGRTLQLIDLRWYVYDVQLIDKAGKVLPVTLTDDEVFQWQQVGLLDFEDKSGACSNGTPQINTRLLGKVAQGDYERVRFRIGMSPAQSHGNPAEQKSPLTLSGLQWSWRLGHKYLRVEFEMEAQAEQEAGAYEFHLGSIGCTGKQGDYRCSNDNLPRIELAAFDPDRDKIVLDLAALLADTPLVATPPATSSGCTSDPDDDDCAPLFEKLGLDYVSGQASPKPQSVFRHVPRCDLVCPVEDDPIPTDAGAEPNMSSDAAIDAGLPEDFALALPSDFPPPRIPADNPLSQAKVELGRHLFYDTRLSGNQTQSCASCHQHKLAFTDGRRVGLGSTGEEHKRSAMSLANVAYSTTLTWAQPDLTSLERQAQTPMFGDKPVELGMMGKEEELFARIRAVAKYQELFAAAFPGQTEPVNLLNITRAIASFQRTLISGDSAYDRFNRDDDESAISDSAKRGAELFFTSTVECFHCHGGFTFSDQIDHANQASGEEPFHNTGLYNLDLEGSYPQGNQGVYELTTVRSDKGRFKAPSLRNIAVTAPYMHDGSIATLEGVLDHYAAGGRNITEGEFAGNGFQNRNKSMFVKGFTLTAQQREDLLAFLRSLTDDAFLSNPKFADPWAAAR